MSAERTIGFTANRRGGAAVEFAMIAPPFLLLMFGGLEIALAIHKGSTVQWAIERAARAAALNASITETALQTLVDNNLAGANSGVDVDIAYSTATGTEVTLGRITATYVHPVNLLFLGSFNLNFSTDVTIPLPLANVTAG